RGLYAKCAARAAGGAGDTVFSNADNMGLVGLISAQLLHRQFIRGDGAAPGGRIEYKTMVDRVPIQQLQGTA
ncbi:MAG TPA: hypothetical protein VMM80_04615, partial [Bacteroidota bacterium]|nr:hypothetical protein [Bacteroidota bacterium]